MSGPIGTLRRRHEHWGPRSGRDPDSFADLDEAFGVFGPEVVWEDLPTDHV